VVVFVGLKKLLFNRDKLCRETKERSGYDFCVKLPNISNDLRQFTKLKMIEIPFGNEDLKENF